MQVVLDDIDEEIAAHLPAGVKPEGEKRGDLHSAYVTIDEYLKKLDWKEQKAIADALLGRFMIVDIVVPQGVEPMQVFASVNATGKPLTAADLIRNAVLQRFGTDRAKMEKFYKAQWMSIDGPLLKYRLHDQFFNNLAVQKDSSATRAKTFDVLSNAWKPLTPIGIAKDINPSLASFLSFAAPSGEEDLPEEKKSGEAWEELHEAMVRIREVDCKGAWPYLLPLLDEAKGKGAAHYRRVARCVRLVEALFVRRLLGGLTAAGTRYFFVGLYDKVEADPGGLRDAIYNERNGELRGPPDQQLRELLFTTNVYDKRLTKGARYLLETHERIMHGWTFQELQKYYGDADHIMPRKPNSYKKWGMSKIEYEANVNRIGNIVLLDPETNQKKSNLGGPSKDDWALIKGIYVQAPFYRRCAEISSDFETWGITEIDARTKVLCDFAFSTPDGWSSFG